MTPFRHGIILRAEDRGISIQAWEFVRAMRPDRILVVDMGELARGFPIHLDRYPDAEVATFTSPSLPERQMRDWFDGMDVCFGVETLYGPDVARWAAEAGCATVIQCNPEFLHPDVSPHVTRWWAPTPWRLSHLPEGTKVVPVPVADDRWPFKPPEWTGTLRVLHVAGHAAAADRNGTGLVLEAIRRLRGSITVRIISQDDKLRIPRLRSPIPVEVVTGGVENHWELYADADVLVLPRRYGGLCLERSTPIVMENGTYKPIEHVRPDDQVKDDAGGTRVTRVAARIVDESVTVDVRGLRVTSSSDHLHLVAASPETSLRETKAEQVVPGDWMLVVRPDSSGVSRVEMGPKPVRKGLRRWWETVTLDEGWCRIIGTWLAEGHRNQYARPNRNRPIAEIRWSFGPTVKHFAEEVLDLLSDRGLPATIRWARAFDTPICGTPRKTREPASGCWHVRCRSLWLDEMFTALGLGHLARGKRAPDVPAHLVPSLVGGWLDGDGNEYNGCVSGYSRSTGMILDMWRLCAKRGLLGSISHQGERLDFNGREAAATVASWTQRMHITRTYVKEFTSPHWREHPLGWMVRVRAVERRQESTEVIAIETESGRYIANNLVTHNCLPALEAMASGLALVMSDAEPQRSIWPGVWARSATGMPRLHCPGGRLPLTTARPESIADILNKFATDPDSLRRQQKASVAWALVNRWSVLRPLYEQELAEAMMAGVRR